MGCCGSKSALVEGEQPILANSRTFAPAAAKGGQPHVASKTAILMIEFQNEFTTEGGKLHDGVKGVMASTGMLGNAVRACDSARSKGCRVIHAPISFAKDGSDNPNKGLGILKGCADGELFTEGTWNAELCTAMQPKSGDLVVTGKRGLDAFPGTDLERLLIQNGIETLAIGGFLTNCCVESTMRTACEKGFNVVTLTNCTATSEKGQAAATEGTFGMFSLPMTAEDFVKKLQPEAAFEEHAQGQTEEGVASSSTVVELEGPLQGKAAAADSVELEGPLQGKA